MKFPGIQDRIHALETNKEHTLELNKVVFTRNQD